MPSIPLQLKSHKPAQRRARFAVELVRCLRDNGPPCSFGACNLDKAISVSLRARSLCASSEANGAQGCLEESARSEQANAAGTVTPTDRVPRGWRISARTHHGHVERRPFASRTARATESAHQEATEKKQTRGETPRPSGRLRDEGGDAPSPHLAVDVCSQPAHRPTGPASICVPVNPARAVRSTWPQRRDEDVVAT